MSIVLNEHYSAERSIETRTIGKKPSETLSRVAGYYIDEYGISDKNAVRNKLDLFLLQCDPTASIPKWSKILDFAVSRAFKRKAINIEKIEITEPELKIIDSLDGKQIRRLAFVLLCLSRYWDMVNVQNDHWVNNKDSEIMALANINTSIRRQSAMYARLKELGLIQFSKRVDNTNIRVCFAKGGDSAMAVTDLRNLGYQYMKRCGEPYFECESCGITIRIKEPTKGRRQKYCKECASKIKIKQTFDSMMKRRGAKVAEFSEDKTYIDSV